MIEDSGKENLLNFFAEIDQYLKPGGMVYVSGKNGVKTGVCKDGRFFLEFDGILFQEILTAASGLSIEKYWYSKDTANRTGFWWMNFIL